MKTRDKVLKLIAELKTAKSPQLTQRLALSRKTVAVHLKKLIQAGKITKTGSTRGATYRVGTGNAPAAKTILLHKVLKNADEFQVHSEMELKMSLGKKISKNAEGIVEYAFTEMFNNAIDHSESRKARVEASLREGKFEFGIRDFGVGLFANVQKRFKLEDEYEAVNHVLKGKQTTMPSRHSGEGLFFTSRIADCFSIRSHRLLLTIDNEKKDFHLAERRFLNGTEVRFWIKAQTRKSLNELFLKYSTEDFQFKKGEVRVKLNVDDRHVARSQARRLCFGLEKFDRVVFDFQGVKEIGQAFADEIFRVFANQHPKMEVVFANAERPVEFMILRAIRGQAA